VSISRAALTKRGRGIRLAIFDVDGVLTDGTIYIGRFGEEFKAFNILDGHGLKMLREAGVTTAILSGRSHKAVDRRAKELSIDHVIQGRSDKLPEFEKLLKRLRMPESACAYMGDDLPDLAVMRRCGLAIAVANAVDAVKSKAHYVTRASGGHGAVREACELILAARGQLGAAGAV
jgi:3-deoxy-D-manno-octulosonate 8-phosphate phosphatase (KDO 8-P phosphatase)